ncbi:hypothetical protein F5Y11DRAFT_330929 [Daldinia sp. FL1419]|nr:hypothetical protein F5Y11DRAFT_330929 [Daldinia sp. FL1419]
MEEAKRVFRILVPMMAGYGAAIGSFIPSAIIMILLWLYNDLGGANAGPLQRNVINAVACACFGWGAYISLYNFGETVNTRLCNWIIVTAAVIMTTTHAQDLPDMLGNKARDRKTIHLIYGERWARATLAILVPLWSVSCLVFWNIKSPVAWIPALLLSSIMSLTAVLCREYSYDEIVWKLLCL